MITRGLKRLAQQQAITSISHSRCARCSPAVSQQFRVGPTFLAVRFASTQSDRSENYERIPERNHRNDRDRASFKPAPKLPSHKPPKRRLEAASAPLRNAPSPTRGPVLQCIAHTTAERYDLVNLGLVLRGLGVRWDEVPEGDRDRAFVIGPWKGRGGAERLISGKDVRRTTGYSNANAVEEGEEGEEEEMGNMGFGYGERGEIWVFNSGSFVTWGLTEEEGRAFLREVVRKRGANVEVERLSAKEYEVEEVDFVVDPTAQTEIQGNLILLGRPPELSTFHPSPSLASLLARYTLSLSLSRSSSLSVLEDRLDTHLATVSTLPRALEKYGAQPMRRKEVIRKIGELMTLRMAVNTRGGGLDDTPEFYWSEPELESYFDSVAFEFEIKERIDAINKKIDYAQEVQNTLRALLTEASGHRMEIIIIALIAVEVIIVLIREGPELFHTLAYPFIRFVNGVISGQPAEADADSFPHPPSSSSSHHRNRRYYANEGDDVEGGSWSRRQSLSRGLEKVPHLGAGPDILSPSVEDQVPSWTEGRVRLV